MTSQFDNLMYIYLKTKENPKIRPLTEWLRDLCVEEASKREKSWNFEEWSKTKWADTVRHVHGEEALKWEFLNNTHDKLDHTDKWHLKVFSYETSGLIYLIFDLLEGREISKDKRNLKSRYSIKNPVPLLVKLKEIGVEEDEYHYMLKLG